MKTTIYRQAYEMPYWDSIEVPDEPPEYMLFSCTECENGIFYINKDDYFICVECRGTGKKWCNMY